MAEVTVTSVIDAPVEKVWARIRDFNGLPSWHPRMVESHIEDGLASDKIGAVRNFTLASGAKIRERLVESQTTTFSAPTRWLRPLNPLPIIRRRCGSHG